MKRDGARCFTFCVLTVATLTMLTSMCTLNTLMPDSSSNSFQHFNCFQLPTAKRGLESSSDSAYISDQATFAEGGVTYRVPRRAFETLSSRDNAGLVVGVLSVAHIREPRDWVRKTWAHNRSNVFFLISGDWTDDIHNEFNTMNDLIWVDQPEFYRGVTTKVQTFLAAVHKHIPNYESVLKTDDDVYVKLSVVEDKVQSKKAEGETSQYWGRCFPKESEVIRDPSHRWYVPETTYSEEKYPKYASGLGYVLTKDLVDCVTKNMETRPSIPNEDANTGIHVAAAVGNASGKKAF